MSGNTSVVVDSCVFCRRLAGLGFDDSYLVYPPTPPKKQAVPSHVRNTGRCYEYSASDSTAQTAVSRSDSFRNAKFCNNTLFAVKVPSFFMVASVSRAESTTN